MCDIRIEGNEIIVFQHRQDLHMLTLDKIDDDGNEQVHVGSPRQDIMGQWSKADLVAQCNIVDWRFFACFAHKLSYPEIYLKEKSYAFPGFLPPYDYVQLCDVVIITMNSSELEYVKQECDRYKYHITVICDTKLLQLWGI